jgi:hypothetical protein
MTIRAVWLVVQLAIAGHPPIVLEDERQSDLATFWAQAADAVERYSATFAGATFELSAACSVVHDAGDPA